MIKTYRGTGTIKAERFDGSDENQVTFARAWIDGYQVEADE